ncbi:hypothetical protein B0H16DRAFT_1487412 [Mycena metata]|uniref:Uncharacterized protein n=1 Tax=Mycena metata TaxID=1033252 RepID=A0AAD7DCE8_9AGAR|nr:hypothetical protein B0H16DRAFT_1487412 [Mycena metata]
MAVLSRLTAEYLNSQHPPTGNGGLQVLQLRELLRAFFELDKLKNSPKLFKDGVDQIINQPNLLVNWAWVVKPQGSGSRVDIKIRELYLANRLRLPMKTQQSGIPKSILTAEASDPPQRPPTPAPEKRLLQWEGPLEDFPQVYRDFMRYDPQNDVKLHDPRICVINTLGHRNGTYSMKRFHNTDEWWTMTNYEGQLRIDLTPEQRGSERRPEYYDPDSFAVSLMTRELVQFVVGKEGLTPDTAFVVRLGVPRFPDPLMLALYTHDPDQVPRGTWADDVDKEHTFPAIGPENALRIVLYILPLEVEVWVVCCLERDLMDLQPKPQLTGPARIRALVVDYLLGEYGENETIVKMRKVNSSKVEKHKGRTAKCWSTWASVLAFILDQEEYVPKTHITDAAGKKVSNEHLGSLVHCSGPWVGQVLSAHKDVKKATAKNKKGFRDFIDDAEKLFGITTFREQLEKFK